MELIDTHSHIYDEAFDQDRDQAMTRAAEAGVTAVILPGISSAEHDSMTGCAERYPGFAFPCIGLHPTCVGEDYLQEMEFLEEHSADRDFIAIGETGLDYYWSRDYEQEQREAFARQLEMASLRDIPVLIHSRNATEAIFEVLEDVKGLSLKGIFHAFSGSYQTYRRCLGYGDFKFGIGGVCTYKNAGIAEVIPMMSMEDIVLETDCPWLTPVPYRGKRNESSYIGIVAEKVALLRGITAEEVGAVTTATARKLFSL